MSSAKSAFSFVVNLAKFYYTGFCTSHGSSEMKCSVSDTNSLILFESIEFESNVPPTLNLTVLTNAYM